MKPTGHSGVYVAETSADPTIVGVPTGVAVFVGPTERGVLNTPVRLTSWADYGAQFGRFLFNSYVPSAVFQFFGEGGQVCYVVNSGPQEGDVAASAAVGGLRFNATRAGTWANRLWIRIVRGRTDTPVQTFSVEILAAPLAALPLRDLSEIMLAGYIVANGSPQIASTEASPELYAETRILERFVGFSVRDLEGGADSVLAQRINQDSLFVRVAVAEGAELPPGGAVVLRGGAEPDIDPWSRYKAAFAALALMDGFFNLALPDLVHGVAYKVTSEEIWSWRPEEVLVFDTTAASALSKRLLDEVEASKRIFAVLDPPYGCDVQGVIDYRSGVTSGTALLSSYGALYYPWLEIHHPANGKVLWVPPSGPVLGRFAVADAQAGVWRAAAGFDMGTLQTATGLAGSLTQAELASLSNEQVNGIFNQSMTGINIFGSRTLSSDPQWLYITVRRLAIYIEQSLNESLKWAAFEPNGPELWSRISFEVIAFLKGLWMEGALAGTNGSQAYWVICDATNNNEAARAQGMVYVSVGFAPIYPSEFLVLAISSATLPA